MRRDSESNPMDAYGIGAAISAYIETYRHASRQTGRSSRLMEAVRDGDAIVFTSSKHAREFEWRLRDADTQAGKAPRAIQPVCVEPGDFSALAEKLHSLRARQQGRGGRLHFDHEWLEELYARAIRQAAFDVRHFEKACQPPPDASPHSIRPEVGA